jgi:hypothetical protein
MTTDRTDVGLETYTVTDPDGRAETVELPEGLADVFTEAGEQPTAVLTDFLVQAFAQQTNVLVGSEGSVPADIAAMDERMRALFEERFGVTLAEAMGED